MLLASVGELVAAGQDVGWATRELGLSRATYYRRRRRAIAEQLEDRHPPAPTAGPLPEEEVAVLAYARSHPKDGYRRLAWQMVDEDVAALSPSAVYRLLDAHDLLYRWKRSEASGGKRPAEAARPDEVWHTDLLYLWVAGRWYFLISVLDAYSRYIVAWDLALTMAAAEVAAVTHRALEERPGTAPRVVHDNGSQFVANEWRALVAAFELVDIATKVRHPESNGRIERYHRSVREEGLDEQELRNCTHAKEVIGHWVEHYNERRLHAALGYLRPVDYYRGDPQARRTERERKLAEAARRRADARRRSEQQRPLLTGS